MYAKISVSPPHRDKTIYHLQLLSIVNPNVTDNHELKVLQT